MKVSQKGLDLIKKFEGLQYYPYRCPAGKLTIGYGHVIDGKYEKTLIITSPIFEEEAERMLKNDTKIAETIINNSVKTPLTQGKFDALVSLVYNWGGYYFRASKGLQKLNAKDYDGAAKEFFDAEKGVVRANGKVLCGLVNRRQAELRLWNVKA